MKTYAEIYTSKKGAKFFPKKEIVNVENDDLDCLQLPENVVMVKFFEVENDTKNYTKQYFFGTFMSLEELINKYGKSSIELKNIYFDGLLGAVKGADDTLMPIRNKEELNCIINYENENSI